MAELTAQVPQDMTILIGADESACICPECDFGKCCAHFCRSTAYMHGCLECTAPVTKCSRPEQARRELITPRTDLYGLGATMYWAFTGRTLSTAGVDPVHQGPVSGANDSVREVLEALRPELPETLVALVERCTADDPLKRPASVAEILGPLSRSGPRS